MQLSIYIHSNGQSYHAFPDVVPDPNLSKLSAIELRRRIAEHEAKISHHQKAIAQYRGCLNAIESQINVRLPPEVLGEIFKQHMLPWTAPFEIPVWVKYPKLSSSYGWFKIASVCRHWRAVVLSTPELFTRIELNHSFSPLALQWFSRSKEVPLELVGELTNSPELKWEIAFPHMGRMQSLRICARPNTYYPSEWPSVLSCLKSLLLVYHYRENFHYEGPRDE